MKSGQVSPEVVQSPRACYYYRPMSRAFFSFAYFYWPTLSGRAQAALD